MLDRSYFTQTALALGIATALAPAVAQAQEPEPAIVDEANAAIPVRIELIIDTLTKSAQAEVAEQFRIQYAPVSRQYGLYDGDDPELVLRFEFGELDKSANVYVVVAEATYLGDVLHRDEARTCVNCTPADLVSVGLQVVSVAVEQVRDRRVQALMAAAAESTPPAEDEEPLGAPSESKPRPRSGVFGPLGYVGVASTVLGLGTGIAGAFLLDRGVQPNVHDASFTVTDYRTPGQALLGAGLGLIVVGNVLLMVDVAVLAPRRRSKAQAKVDGLAVTVAGHTTGLAIRGRF